MTARLQTDELILAIDGAPILGGISLDLRAGDFVGVIGPNGAGKTTLLRAMAGLLAPTAGVCRLDGAPVHAMAPSTRARRLAYLAQDRAAHWDVSAAALIALGRFAYGAPTTRLEGEDARAVETAIVETGLAALRDRKVSTLSGGEAARVHLARVFAGATPVIIADEPAANLDPAQALAMMRLLRSKASTGGLVIAALHDLALARRFCTRLVVIANGALKSDGPPDAVATQALLEEVFRLSAEDCAALGLW